MLKKILTNLYQNKYLEQIVSTIVLLPVLISFILNPITNDARVYSGLARITDFFGSFPSNIDLTWEVKPIGNRFINYFIYKLDTLFTTFGSLEYETLFKIIVAVIVLLICYYFSTKCDKKYIFLITTMAFLTPLNFITLQPDWWATLFTFLTMSLFLTEKPSNHYIAGVIVTIIFLMKGSTGILILPIVCAIYLYKKKLLERLWVGALGFIMSLLFILKSGLFPNIIPDILLSMKIARIGSIDLITMLFNFIYNTFTLTFYIPAFIVGVYALYFLYMKYMNNKEINKGMILLLMWLTAAISPFIQSEYFLYQYFVLIFPTIITIVLLGDKTIKYSIIIMFIIFIIFSGYWGVGMKVEREFYGDQRAQVLDITNNVTDIKNQDTILYIDSGVAPYYFPSNSSCRYVQPLPFQRNTPEWNVSDTYQYKEEFNCIMNYTGKYIIEDENNWMKQNTTDNKIVWNKINTEYEKVWSLNWNIYKRRSL